MKSSKGQVVKVRRGKGRGLSDETQIKEERKLSSSCDANDGDNDGVDTSGLMTSFFQE